MNPNAFRLSPLRDAVRPFRLYFYSRLRSTNDHAATMRRQQRLYAPAIILAGSQTAGRGRGTNAWWSGNGSLTVTFCLPADDRLPPHHVPLLAGWAVREACIGLTADVDLKLKWPNDLWHHDLKVAGLLCERVDGLDLVGVGLNVNVRRTDIPLSLRRRVSGLWQIAGRRLAMNDVVAALADSVGRWLLKRTDETFAAVRGQYDDAHALHGRRVGVVEPGGDRPTVGVVRGLDADGRLLLSTPAGTVRRIVAGSVTLA